MCGIAGSTNFKKSFKLYKNNLIRGTHSSGFLAFSKNKDLFYLKKISGVFEEQTLTKEFKFLSECDYFLFHSRAPTNSTETTWNEKNCHPFKYGNYYVAHNGIISNFRNIKGNENFTVDSNIIPFLLENENLINVYSKLEGLLSSWIFNEKTKELYIAKAGSTLWKDTDSFSSIKYEKVSEKIEDGSIFKLNSSKILEEQKEKFKYQNAYFIL